MASIVPPWLQQHEFLDRGTLVLARALWETDERTLTFIESVSDVTHPEDTGKPCQRIDPERWARALDTAWNRNEPPGVREESLDRAQRLSSFLLQCTAKGII